MIAATVPTKLTSYATDVYAVYHELADDSVYQLKRSAAIYEAWAEQVFQASSRAADIKRDPQLVVDVRNLAAISDESLSRCLKDLKDYYSQAYLRKIRGDWMTLLRAAAGDKLCAEPDKVRPIAKPKPKARAWTHGQVEAIVASALKYEGKSAHGLELPSYFAGMFMAGWDTGLRKADLQKIAQTMIGDDGRIRITQNKTDDEHFCRVRPETLRVLRSIGRTFPLRWPGADCQFYYHLNRIVERAGVPLLGGMQAMRKSGSTDVARIAPGLETRFLGHTTAAADAFYIDRSIAGGSAPMPTPLNLPRLAASHAG